MPVMNYRKGTEKRKKAGLLKKPVSMRNIQENVNLFSHREMDI